jgi:hypothetical protein
MNLGELLKSWIDELDDLKATLYSLGDKAESMQYSLLAAEALRLSMCIIEMQKHQLGEQVNVRATTI